MKKVLNAEDLTSVHQAIMKAVQSSAAEAPSRLTARGPLALLRQVLPREMKEDGGEASYVLAVTALIRNRWILVVSPDAFSGLARYRLSHEADIYLRQLVDA